LVVMKSESQSGKYLTSRWREEIVDEVGFTAHVSATKRYTAVSAFVSYLTSDI